MKKFSVACIGCGGRGFVYTKGMYEMKGQFEVVSVCDFNQWVLDRVKKEFGLLDENLFLDEGAFFEKKRADVLIIATQDRDHVRMCVRALELGYDVLLEKPISPVKEELEELLSAQKKYGGKVVVCHVLRYSPGFVKIKELLDKKAIGDLVRIESIEQVTYWHQAHSFVRGNWRDENQTSAMIMQKCCHDLDLLQYYVGAKCDSVYSTGSLKFFNRENQPQGASDRCAECKYVDDCVYSAENVYVKRWKKMGSPAFRWPFNVVDTTIPNTEESLRKAYASNQYGRCVFACDNNVVDNQAVVMKFANGVDVSLTMTAFTSRSGRKITFHGTLGEMELLEQDEDIIITVYPFGGEEYSFKGSELQSLGDDEFSHGGGDQMLIRDFYDIVSGSIEASTELESSVESHLIALAAETSRKMKKVVMVH